MKVCEVCGGVGCGPSCIICTSCHGTGMICLGHESADRYEWMKVEARIKAARLGWIEEDWIGQWPESRPRKVLRVIQDPLKAKAS